MDVWEQTAPAAGPLKEECCPIHRWIPCYQRWFGNEHRSPLSAGFGSETMAAFLDYVHTWLVSWLSINLQLWMAWWTVFTDIDLWKCSWAHFSVISKTESWHLRATRSGPRSQRILQNLWIFSWYCDLYMMRYSKSLRFYVEEHYS